MLKSYSFYEERVMKLEKLNQKQNIDCEFLNFQHFSDAIKEEIHTQVEEQDEEMVSFYIIQTYINIYNMYQ